MKVRTTITASCTYELDVDEYYTHSNGEIMTIEEIRKLEDDYAHENLLESNHTVWDVEVKFVH